jgi:hypothetical protein
MLIFNKKIPALLKIFEKKQMRGLSFIWMLRFEVLSFI